MAQISRLKDAEISNGNIIDADDIDAELNQLVSAHNTNDTELTSIGTGAYTFTGVKTFSSTPKMNAIDERSAGSGVTIDSVLLKDGFIRVPAGAGFTPTTNGDFGYDSTSHTYDVYVNGAAKYMIHSGNVADVQAGYPKGYMEGPPPTYASAATITIPTGLRVRSSDNTADIEVTSDLTPSLAASGANGLDSGAEASGTWYYVYLIKNVSTGTVASLFSTVNEAVSGSITLPSGYTVKRQLPLAVRNDGSSNIIPFYIATGWPIRPQVMWDVTFDDAGSNTTEVVSGGTQITTFSAAVSCASFVPPISRQALFHIYNSGAANRSAYIRSNGSSNNGLFVSAPQVGATTTPPIPVDSSQQIQYKLNAATAHDISVLGYVVTEVK